MRDTVERGVQTFDDHKPCLWQRVQVGLCHHVVPTFMRASGQP
jgi:hypothetical protein